MVIFPRLIADKTPSAYGLVHYWYQGHIDEPMCAIRALLTVCFLVANCAHSALLRIPSHYAQRYAFSETVNEALGWPLFFRIGSRLADRLKLSQSTVPMTTPKSVHEADIREHGPTVRSLNPDRVYINCFFTPMQCTYLGGK